MQPDTNPDETLRCLQQISRWVQQFLPSSLDGDYLVTEIWLECWQKSIQPSRRMVRFRCIDLMRKELKRQACEPSDDTPHTDVSSLESRDILNRLMSMANFSPKTKHLLYLLYYRSLNITDAAFELRIPVSHARTLHDSALQTLRLLHDAT
jgi:DNA-directed RNA polymerase specialized sigma24 family protein